MASKIAVLFQEWLDNHPDECKFLQESKQMGPAYHNFRAGVLEENKLILEGVKALLKTLVQEVTLDGVDSIITGNTVSEILSVNKSLSKYVEE